MIPKKIPTVFKEFGKERIDNYFWMRNKQDPDVLKYIRYENKETDKWFSDSLVFQKKIFQELKARKRERDESVPYFYNGYWYIKKFEKGKEYPVLYRKKESLKAKAEKILDQNLLAQGKKYFQIGAASVSPNNRYIAYAEDVKANRKYTIRIKDLITGKNLKDVVPGVSASFEWSNDSTSLLYVAIDATTQRPFQVRHHVLGTTDTDKIVFEEVNELYYVHIAKTRSKEYFLVHISSHDHEFFYYAPTKTEEYAFQKFMPAKPGVIYDIDHGGGFWYIRTNERAVDFEVLKVSDKAISRKKWETFIPPRDGVEQASFVLFEEYFVYEEIVAGIPYFKIVDLKTNRICPIKFKEKVYGGSFLFNPEYTSTTLRISFETMKNPETEYECELKNGKLRILKTHEPRGKFSPENYLVERVWATGHDGAKIPISLLYRKGLKKNGKNPCLLYGYGSYGHTLLQEFNENIFSLVDRGFVYAIAHIRGGQEMGRCWYLEGKFLKKKNTFLDFISCAEFLIQKKYTSSEFLVARGGSAGGLLMGAIANMRPDLFRGVVLQVPFVDVINTMMDPSIPLTVGEYVEWGNPQKKKFYEYMKSYAPYENIEKKEYPTLFVDSGFHDTQVHYWEPLKYVAKMKELKVGKNPVLLHMDLESGHGGKSGRFSYLIGIARVYTFIFKLLGVKK